MVGGGVARFLDVRKGRGTSSSAPPMEEGRGVEWGSAPSPLWVDLSYARRTAGGNVVKRLAALSLHNLARRFAFDTGEVESV